MDNTPSLPVLALAGAAGLVVAVIVSIARRVDGVPNWLNEAEIGLTAVAFTLIIFGIQGLIGVLVEGRELYPGRVRPRLTGPLSAAIVVFSLALFAIAVALGISIVQDWEPWVIGTFAGVGCLILSTLLVFYKEAFVGDEAHFDQREDGVPW